MFKRETPSRKGLQLAGFTLVELLVVMLILGVLSGMFALAYRGAQQEALLQKTRTTIQKINDCIQSRLQEYETYNVPLGISAAAVPIPGAGQRASLIERARLLMLREIMRTEMPDHPDDLKATTFWLSITQSPVVIRPIATGLVDPITGPLFVPKTPILPIGLTSRAATMFAKLSSVPQWDLTNANAELLFLIVEDSDLDGASAIEMFGSSEIGDTDGDRLNEFLDGYGNPIRWIRWPSGFAQLGRAYPDMLNPAIVDGSGNLTINSEPADRLRVDPGWYASNKALLPGVFPAPLIVSAGLDGFFGLNFREVDRYSNPSPGEPRWPITNGNVDYSVSALPFPEAPPYAPAPFRFSDPWGPRLDPTMRMGSLLVRPPAAGTHDPKEGGLNARETDPATAAGDNVTNYEGGATGL